MDLVVASYRVSRRLPPSERFELASQIRRSATSIPANIAEGYAQIHRGNYIRHLSIARGSAAELETHLDVCQRLGYTESQDLGAARELVDHVSRMLTAMLLRMRRDPPR